MLLYKKKRMLLYKKKKNVPVIDALIHFILKLRSLLYIWMLSKHLLVFDKVYFTSLLHKIPYDFRNNVVNS